MLHDPKTFEVTSAGPLRGPKFKTPEQIAAEKKERREQDKALALMLTYIGIVIFATWTWGVQGLVAWALTSAALAAPGCCTRPAAFAGTADE